MGPRDPWVISSKYFTTKSPGYLEYQFVRINAVGKGECGTQVAPKLRHLFDGWQELGVHSLLVCFASLCDLIFLRKQTKICVIYSFFKEHLNSFFFYWHLCLSKSQN